VQNANAIWTQQNRIGFSVSQLANAIYQIIRQKSTLWDSLGQLVDSFVNKEIEFAVSLPVVKTIANNMGIAIN
jgi:hypothetical protein